MKNERTAMALFHPLVAKWFLERIGEPTDVQKRAWPPIASGEHVLISAPTGSGKTLAAFLWSINEMVTGKWSTGHTRVLYVSPLKALNNDIQRNLLIPLHELEEAFKEAGEAFPHLHVLTRSGDTPYADRRRMQRHPPEILITTPESLNLLLSSLRSRALLKGLKTVILDEIHGVLENRRGVHLITAVDRLVPLSGEFQRIALSATVRPLQGVADFVGGYRIEGSLRDPIYKARPVRIVCTEEKKRYHLRVLFAEGLTERRDGEGFWNPFVEASRKIIGNNRATLLFTNSRRLCEKLTHLINLGEASPAAYAHHGSLSREIRRGVEQKLKAGELKCIVATNSLELGIDIGALDEVVLIQSPPSVSSAVQRIGRAGHRVGQVSRGTLLPTDSQDFLEAAVLTSCVLSQDIGTLKPLECPLDVLAQVILSMVGVEPWDADALFGQLRSSYPYGSLDRKHFDLVLHMLAGRYEDSRIRELKPRVAIDRLDNTVSVRKGALQALYASIGTIPDRGYFQLRHQETHARIGELDEEFVWEASIGQTFTLGTQKWRIERITHNDVFVAPANANAAAPPFWRSEEINRNFHFSERIGQFLEKVNDRLEDAGLPDSIMETHCMDPKAAERLVAFLKRQRERTGCHLPHRHHVLVEFIQAGPGGYPGTQLVLHTLWGGRVNRPFAIALQMAWKGRFEQHLEVYPTNDCLTLLLPHEVGAREVLSMVTSRNAQSLLKEGLESTGFFGARFRECAGRALLLSRRRINERMPLWLSRLRSQKLLDAVFPYEDFPILLEAWRTCLRDEFDLEALFQVLSELEEGSIAWTEITMSHPSPMAQSATWQQINQYMYGDDQLPSKKTSSLRDDLIREVVLSPALRPAVSQDLVERFEARRKRLSSGYSPETSGELLEWAKERLLVPQSEWIQLLGAVRLDHGIDPKSLLEPVGEKLVRIQPVQASGPLVCAREMLPRIMRGFYAGAEITAVESLDSKETGFVPEARAVRVPAADRAETFRSLLREWLQFYGPKTASSIQRILGVEVQQLERCIEDLRDGEEIVSGRLVTELTEDHLCDSENFETLLRLSRLAARPAFEPLNIDRLPLFLARYQGVLNPGNDLDDFFRTIEQLACYPALAARWESEIFPARVKTYDSTWLDAIMLESDLRWIGTGNRRILFCFESDLDLIQRGAGLQPEVTDDRANGKEAFELGVLFPDIGPRYDFSTLLKISGWRPAQLADRLWSAVWRGQVTNDRYTALRRGIEHGFKIPQVGEANPGRLKRGRRLGGRAAFSKWRGALPLAGNWLRVAEPSREPDPLEIEERRKDRARMLLDRYGIVFRELIQNELPAFRWPAVFRALRIMELSGEVLAGYFFHGVPGPQFISHEAYRLLQTNLPEEAIYWIEATDPASLCGLPLERLKGMLPRRVAGTHLVYRGRRLVAVSRGNGKRILFQVPEDDPDLQIYLYFLHHLLKRQFQPLRRITIETINGKAASDSPYLDALRRSFDVSIDTRHVILYRS